MKNIKFLLASLILLVGLTSASMAQQTVTIQPFSGGNFSLEAQKGKVVVLAIGATWLPLSRQQVTIANKLAKKYAGKDVAIYFVTTESANAKSKNHASDDQVREFATRNKLSLPVLRDDEGVGTLKPYKVDQLPSFVILDKQGNLAGAAFGGLDTEQAALDTLTNLLSQTIDKLL